jgi:hypothetical protein
MKLNKAILTVAALGMAFGTAALAAASKPSSVNLSEVRSAVTQEQSKQQEQVRTFTGTISKNGEQFILAVDSGKGSYLLDDQQTAGKYAGKRVRVTGILDASNNTIRVQSIEEASA